jgi:hypothetical protein
MTDVLLTVGKVLPAQVETLRVAMLMEGMMPVVVHIPSEYADSAILRGMLGVKLAGDGEPIPKLDSDGSQLTALEKNYLVSLLGDEGATLQSVKAVLAAELLPEEEMSDNPWEWVYALLPAATCYQVRRTHDNEGYWLDGDDTLGAYIADYVIPA